MFSGLESPAHLIIVLVVAMLVLGPKRLPQVGRSLGSGIRQFKASLEGKDEEEASDKPEPPRPRRRRTEPPRSSPDPSLRTLRLTFCRHQTSVTSNVGYIWPPVM